MNKQEEEVIDTIDVPELVLGPIRYTIGEANQLLRPAYEAKILSEDTVQISPRVTERRLHLDSGERVVVTSRSKVALPTGTHGVLQILPGGGHQWLAHRELAKAEKTVKKSGLGALAREASSSWRNSIQYRAEKLPINENSDRGLRPPQLGALFAVGSHWSLNSNPATVIMPTGTGKTETMLAVTAAHQIDRVLVAVPSKALRSQTAAKFREFGLLRWLGVLRDSATNPVVGTVKRRPRTADDLALFRDCNVVVGTPSSLSGGTAESLLVELGQIVDVLVVDEAHHVAAKTWRRLKRAFGKKKVLQFTATPFRNDNQLVDGSVIYSYPLGAAQDDGYFTSIAFEPIYELDDSKSDAAIAGAAISKLRDDLANGCDHLLMARCRSVDRATAVYEEYRRLAPDLSPLLIHSNLSDSDERVEKLKNKAARIVVCVNMLGEGVDVPALKIAAVHDSHQSLAVLLQFVGRFTRTSGDNLGTATVIANIANPNVLLSLEQLYNQDSDWNSLLSELSSKAAQEHAEFVQFLEESSAFEIETDDLPTISAQSLRPVFSTLVYKSSKFLPKSFHLGIPDRYVVVSVWLNENTQTLYFITRSSARVKWTRSKEVEEVEWDLFVLHFDATSQLLYVASTNKDSNFDTLAQAVGATDQISGEVMFRSLGKIGRLVFNNLGVTKHGRRNLSFAMYTGADVKQALSETEKQGSRKSNISGYGWEYGHQITIGCSYKGRVWSKAAGTVPQFLRWAESIGSKLVDETIDTKSVIANVLIPDYADKLPDFEVLSVEWPVELTRLAEERVSIVDGLTEYEFYMLDLVFESIDRVSSRIGFSLLRDGSDQPIAEYQMTVKGQAGFDIVEGGEKALRIVIGNREYGLADFFRDYPPLVRFVDLSELDGNILLRAESSGVVPLPEERLVPWDWAGVDMTKESIWKDGAERRDSIQWKVAQKYIDDGYAVVFDDDGAGEAADLVCMTEDDDHIKLALVHCKFSGAAEAGKRVKDVVEVASQAVRSARRPGKFKELLKHVAHRHTRRRSLPNRNFFLNGDLAELTRLERAARFKEVRTDIVIVQPGVSKENVTQDQSTVLGAAVAYVKQTLGIDLEIICSP